MKFTRLTLVGVCTALVLSGCANIAPENRNTAQGAAIGAGIGAVLGKATGNHKNKRLAIGAAIGSLAGAAVGRYMDNQESALREQLSGTGVQVHRDGNNLRLDIPSQITFNINSANIAPGLYSVLNDVAKVFGEYDKTLLVVSGHTDDTGTYQYNMDLSLKRAQSVQQYLVGQGVQAIRIETQGLGPNYPLVANTSEANRAKNRRVEIHIEPITQ